MVLSFRGYNQNHLAQGFGTSQQGFGLLRVLTVGACNHGLSRVNIFRWFQLTENQLCQTRAWELEEGSNLVSSVFSGKTEPRVPYVLFVLFVQAELRSP